MILADKIINHRKRLNLTQEQLAEKLDVSRQSISKWEGALSITDTDKLLALSNIFGVSVDYLLKDDMEDVEYIESDVYLNQKLSMMAANEYISLRLEWAKKIAFGVLLCIISPVALILFNELSENAYVEFSKYSPLGLIILILLVATAVSIFIKSNFVLKKYEFIEKDTFDSEYGVESLAKKALDEYQNTHSNKIIIAILLIITSVIWIFLADVFDSVILDIVKVSLLLIMVGLGVYLLVESSVINSTYKQLLQIEDYSIKNKQTNKKLAKYYGIYWLVIVSVYLYVSFTNSFQTSWIIFPIAGVSFGVFSILVSIFVSKDKK